MKRAMNARELMIDDEGVTRFQHGARLRYRFLPLRFASWLMHHRARKYAGRGMSNVTRVAAVMGLSCGASRVILRLEMFAVLH